MINKMKFNGAFPTKRHFYNLLHAKYLIVSIKNMSLIFVKYIHIYEGRGEGVNGIAVCHGIRKCVYIRLSWLKP